MLISKKWLMKIDKEDIPLLAGKTPSFDGRYATIFVETKKVYIHRIVAGIKTSGKKMVVDHINGDKLDNRKNNLRIVGQSINIRNRKPMPNKTGFPGVHFSPWSSNKNGGKYLRKKPFKAEVKKDGKKYHIGRFETAIEAFEAYRKRVVELFGTQHPIFMSR